MARIKGDTSKAQVAKAPELKSGQLIRAAQADLGGGGAAAKTSLQNI